MCNSDEFLFWLRSWSIFGIQLNTIRLGKLYLQDIIKTDTAMKIIINFLRTKIEKVFTLSLWKPNRENQNILKAYKPKNINTKDIKFSFLSFHSQNDILNLLVLL